MSIVRTEKGSALVIVSVLIFCVVILSANLGNFMSSSFGQRTREDLRMERDHLRRVVRTLVSDGDLCKSALTIDQNQVLVSGLDQITRRVTLSGLRLENPRHLIGGSQEVDLVFETSCHEHSQKDVCAWQERIPLVVRFNEQGTAFDFCTFSVNEKLCQELGGLWEKAAHSCDLCPGQWVDGQCVS